MLSFRKSTVGRSVVLYTFSNFLTKGISFVLLLFLFTKDKYIDRSENGLLSLFNNSMIFLMPFVSMGLLQSTSTDFFKMGKKEFRNFFTTSFLMPFIVMLLALIGLFILKDYLRITYGFPFAFVWLIPIITFLIFCNEQLISLIRNNREPERFLGVSVSRAVMELGLAVLLIVFFAWRWKGRVAGIFISQVIMGVYAFFYFKKKGYLFGNIKKAYIRDELIYAIPIIAMQAGVFALSASDKFFLSYFTSDNNQTVGIYSVACVFASVINTLCMAIIHYIFPKIFATLSSDNIDYASIRTHFFYYLGVMCVGTLIILGCTPLLYKFFINEKYHSALHYIFFIGIGYFFWAIAYYFYSFLLFFKLKKKILVLSLLSIGVSLLCNYIFIKRWHAYGGAVSVCVSYFIVLLMTMVTVRGYIQNIFFSKTTLDLKTVQ